MKVLVLTATCLLAFATTAFAQDTTPSPTDTAPTAPTTTIERGATTPSPTETSTTSPRAKHHAHRHAVAAQNADTQHSDKNLGTEVRPRAATAMPTPGSSALGNRSDDPAGPTTVITR